MSFSPYSTMITVCVCFNSRVQLTVPSFTAWPRSRYSKTLFIVLRWPAQEKDKSVSVRDATLLKRGRAGPMPAQRCSCSPGQGRQDPETPTSPHLQAALGIRGSTGPRIRWPEFRFWLPYCLAVCGQASASSLGNEVLIPSSQDHCDAWGLRGADRCQLRWLQITRWQRQRGKGALECVPWARISPVSTFCLRIFRLPSGWDFAFSLPSH